MTPYCPRCHGDGEIAFNPSERVPRDPQLEDSAPCPYCSGSGADPACACGPEILSNGERWAMVNRADLLEGLCQLKREQGWNWLGVLRSMPEHTTGGSSADRKLIAQAMLKLEQR